MAKYITRQKTYGSAHGNIDIRGNGVLTAIASPHYRPDNMVSLVRAAVKKRQRDVSKFLRKRIKADIARAGAA